MKKFISLLFILLVMISTGICEAKAYSLTSNDETPVGINIAYKSLKKEKKTEEADPGIKINKTDNMCNGLFYENGQKTEFATLLQMLLNVIKYAAPILVLVFSVAEFVKAIASQDKDAINKATKNSAWRLGIAVGLYFLPLLINFLVNLFLGIKDPTCGLM